MSSSLKMLALSHVFAVGWRTTETQATIAVTWSEPLQAVSCPDNNWRSFHYVGGQADRGITFQQLQKQQQLQFGS